MSVRPPSPVLWFVLLAFVGGCVRAPAPAVVPAADASPPVWAARGIDVDGTSIDLGFRTPAAGEGVRYPVAALTKEGRPVADAMVFMQGLTAEGNPTDSEVAAVFEPGTEQKPACYVGELPPPTESNATAIRFRVLLAGAEREWTQEVVLPAGKSSSDTK